MVKKKTARVDGVGAPRLECGQAVRSVVHAAARPGSMVLERRRVFFAVPQPPPPPPPYMLHRTHSPTHTSTHAHAHTRAHTRHTHTHTISLSLSRSLSLALPSLFSSRASFSSLFFFLLKVNQLLTMVAMFVRILGAEYEKGEMESKVGSPIESPATGHFGMWEVCRGVWQCKHAAGDEISTACAPACIGRPVALTCQHVNCYDRDAACGAHFSVNCAEANTLDAEQNNPLKEVGVCVCLVRVAHDVRCGTESNRC